MRKEHKKMYKAGKRWVTALLTVTTLGIAGVTIAENPIVHADTPSTNSTASSNSNTSDSSSSTSTSSDDGSSANSSASSSNTNESSASSSSSDESTADSSASAASDGSSANSSSTSSASNVSSTSSNAISSSSNTSSNASSDSNVANSTSTNASSNASVTSNGSSNSNQIPQSSIYLTSDMPQSDLKINDDNNQYVFIDNATQNGYPQYSYLQYLYLGYIDQNTANNFQIVESSQGNPDVIFKPKPGDNSWYNGSYEINTAYLYNSNGVSLRDNKLTTAGQIYKIPSLNNGSFNSDVVTTLMSVPVVQINYVDSTDGSQVGDPQYVDANNGVINAGYSFTTPINTPDGYVFDTSYQPKTTSNYKTTIDNSYFNSNVPMATQSYDSVDNNDSKLQLTNVNDNNATLNGTFYQVKTDSVLGGFGDDSIDWAINAINIPVTKYVAPASSAPASAGSSANSSSTPASASSSANSSSAPSSASSSAKSSSTPSLASSSANSSSAPSSASSSASAQSIASSSDSSFKYADSVNHSVLSSASSAASSASSTASSVSSHSSVASSAAVKYYKMYNNKTTLVKKNHKIHIFIEPKFAPTDDKGSVHDQYVVNRKLKNGDISHEQEITLPQYRSMLVASGKKSISKKGLAKAYTKRKHLNGIQRNKEDKTTFNAAVKKTNGETLINLNGQSNGFKPLTKDQKRVKDTQDIRVKIHNKH